MYGNYKFHLSIFCDNYGCGYYRIKFPDMCLSSKDKYFRLFTQQTPFRDSTVIPYLDTVRIQRWFSSVSLNYFLKELVPASKKYGFKIIYDVDDILCYDDMPEYNLCKQHYYTDQDYLKIYLDNSDIITTTTIELRDYYINKYNLSESKFKVIPNFIPKWWYGSIYNEQRSIDNYDKNIKRPTITFCCGCSHFDMNNTNNGIDDFTHIIDWVVENRKKYLFSFMGGIPKQLINYKDDFRFIQSSDLLLYPYSRSQVDTNLYIQPLVDSEFNRCKSNIKQLEAWSEGVPVITQNISCYNKYDSKFVFNTSDELDGVVTSVLESRDNYRNIIKNNYDKMEYFWLENNIGQWKEVLDG